MHVPGFERSAQTGKANPIGGVVILIEHDARRASNAQRIR
jgi:hypothetical protein